jgi:hypothetical protein
LSPLSALLPSVSSLSRLETFALLAQCILRFEHPRWRTPRMLASRPWRSTSLPRFVLPSGSPKFNARLSSAVN